jgi:hypothetical protein
MQCEHAYENVPRETPRLFVPEHQTEGPVGIDTYPYATPTRLVEADAGSRMALLHGAVQREHAYENVSRETPHQVGPEHQTLLFGERPEDGITSVPSSTSRENEMPVGRETRGVSNGPAAVGNALVKETAFGKGRKLRPSPKKVSKKSARGEGAQQLLAQIDGVDLMTTSFEI